MNLTKNEMNSGAPEGLSVPAPLVAWATIQHYSMVIIE
jgi:hypothetical protein